MSGYLAQPWSRRGLLVLLGAFAALGQAPTDLWFATIVALSIWLAVYQATPHSKSAFGTGWWFGLGYFAIALRWIVEPFLVDAATYGWMAPFAIVFMASGAGLFWGAASWVSYRLAPNSVVTAIGALALTEVVRSYILTGFPWALIGHIWIDTPIGQTAALWGPHGLTLVTLLLSASVLLLARRRWLAFAGPLGALALWISINADPRPATEGQPMIRIVQPNVLQNEKWDPVQKPINFRRTLDLSSSDGADIDLIVWPETAVADLLEYAQPSLDEMSDVAAGVPLVTGIQRRASPGIFHNSLIVLGRGGEVNATYDKKHLVPFGEYFPGGELAARLGLVGFASSQGFGFTKGDTAELIDILGIGAVRPLICYEGIFAEEIVTGDGRARVLLLITNDAWFGKGAGPEQHLAQARLRAIEQGLPMIRAANTGISAMIDARGNLLETLPLDTAGFMDVSLPDPLPETIYVRLGDLPAALSSFLLLGLGIRRLRAFAH